MTSPRYTSTGTANISSKDHREGISIRFSADVTAQPASLKSVVVSEDTVIYYPDNMETEIPYNFKFLEHNMAVIKRTSGDLDVFYFPNDEEGA